MRRLFNIFILAIAITACNNHNANDKHHVSGPGSTDPKKQRSDSLFKLRTDSARAASNALYQVAGKIKFRKMWCGGVQIRPGDNSYKARPYKNKKVIIIRGNINSDTCSKVEELTTNAMGEFMFKVKPGLYGIIVEGWKQVKFKPLPGNPMENACLFKEYKKPDILVQVKNEPVSNLSFTVIGYCSGGNICAPARGADRP